MRILQPRSVLPLAVLAGLALGVAGTVAAAAVVAPRSDAGPASLRAAIDQALAPRTVAPTGQTRRFELVVRETTWELVPGVSTSAMTFNGTVPGPTIRVTEGDTVEVSVRNDAAEATSVHWHGLHIPNDQDGVAGITQNAIAPGATFTYRFTAPHAGTFMYHAHGPSSREQIDRGLSGAFLIAPRGTDPLAADAEYVLSIGNWMVGDAMATMGPMSMGYNYFTINGKSYPATEAIAVAQGALVRLRFVNPSQTLHPMHLHGMDMVVAAKDGETLVTPQRLNTLDIAPGDTYDVLFRADNPGTWLLHCHDLHHVSNAGQEPGGLIVPVIVGGAGPAASAPPSATNELPAATPGHTMAPGMTAMPGMSDMPGMTN